MAKVSKIVKAAKKQKFSTRIIRRCWRCGRNRAYLRFFQMCRICVREMAEKGDLPGVRKSSW